jgi:hypothetical protein
MRFIDNILQALWNGLTSAPPAACCPGCCIHFANFR